MTVVLNHTVVAVGDKERAARLLADLLGLEVEPQVGPFVPVRINQDLTLDFDDRLGSRPDHYAFLVDDATFDRALGAARSSGLEQGSAPRAVNYEINRLNGGRGVYVRDPDGVAYELFTAVPQTFDAELFHLLLHAGLSRRSYNSHRPHRSLSQRAPSALDAAPALIGDVDLARLRRTNHLGGLIHEYRMVA